MRTLPWSRRFTMKKLLLLVLLIVVVAFAWWFFAGRDSRAKIVRAPTAVPVTVAKVEARDTPVVLEAVGRSEAYASVTLKSRVDGQVAEVPYSEGQHVAAGDVLVRIDPGDFAARLQQAEANLAKSRVQLAKAKLDVERYVDLKNRGFVSAEKLSDMRTSEAAAEAQLSADTAARNLARLQLDYATIRAPFAGIVGARLVFPGTGVKTNDTALAVVNRVRPILVSFTLPEKSLPRLRAAMRQGPLAVSVKLPGDAGPPLRGEARFIDNAVGSTTGTILVKAQLANEDEKLTPGQFVDVSLAVDTMKGALVLPAQALQQGPQGNFVFVVNSEGKAQPRKVDLAFARAGLAVFAAGLQEGETVVTDGQLRLTAGAKVDMRAAATEKQPAQTAAAAAPATAAAIVKP